MLADCGGVNQWLAAGAFGTRIGTLTEADSRRPGVGSVHGEDAPDPSGLTPLVVAVAREIRMCSIGSMCGVARRRVFAGVEEGRRDVTEFLVEVLGRSPQDVEGQLGSDRSVP